MTHLDELIALCRHPKIQERRGEWQVGDRIYGAAGNGIVIVVHKYALTVSFPKGCVMLEKDIIAQPPRHIWLPPLSDPLRPERGLIGILKGEWMLMNFDKPSISSTPHHPFTLIVKGERGFVFLHDGPTPEIAVCKAIIAQEEP